MFDVKILLEDKATKKSTVFKDIDQYEVEELIEQTQELTFTDYDYILVEITKRGKKKWVE